MSPSRDRIGPGSLRPLLVRSTLLNVAARVMSLAGWLLLAPFMVSVLGPARFGFWAVLGAASGFLLTFDLGVGQALTKFLAEYHDGSHERERNGVLTLGLVLYGGMGLLWSIALAACRGWVIEFFRVPDTLRSEASAALMLAATGALVTVLSSLLGSVLAGLHRLDTWNRILLAVTLGQLLATAAVLAAGRGLVAVVLVQVVFASLAVGLGTWAVRRADPRLRIDARGGSRAMLARMFDFGAALQLVNLGTLALFQLPKLFLGRLVSLPAVGEYELALRVGLTAWTLPLMVVPPLLPALSHLVAVGDRERVRGLYLRATRYVLTSGFLLGAGLVVLSAAFYASWLGPGHEQAVLFARVFGVLMAINLTTAPGSLIVRASGRPWIEARYHILSTVLLALGSMIAVPPWGERGQALAMGIAVSAGTLYFLVAHARAFEEPLGRHLLRMVAPPALAALAGIGATVLLLRALPVVAFSTGRAAASARLFAGGGVLVSVTIVLLFASRYLRLDDVRELLRPHAGAGPPR